MEEDNKEQNKNNQTNYNSKEGDNNNVTPSAIPFHIAYPTPNNYSFIYPFNCNNQYLFNKFLIILIIHLFMLIIFQ